MSKTPNILGHLDCPLCGLEGDVREDKNGNPFFFCPDCTCQILTHGKHRAKLMLEKMRPVAIQEPEELPKSAPRKKTLMG